MLIPDQCGVLPRWKQLISVLSFDRIGRLQAEFLDSPDFLLPFRGRQLGFVALRLRAFVLAQVGKWATVLPAIRCVLFEE